MRKIEEKRRKSMAAVALNYNLVRGITPVVGVRKIEQAEQDCQALGWRLSDEEIRAIDEVSVKGKTSKSWQQG